MQHFDIDLYNFVFPLPAYLDLTIEEWDESDDDRPLFVVAIDVRQGEALCARAHWRYRAFLPSRLFATEARKAQRVIAQMSHADSQQGESC